jgi:transcriptional regulator with XRE-family HTH domain
MPQVFEDIQIDAEFAALIPPLSAEERQQLEENIIEHGGARDPLVVWVPDLWTPNGCTEAITYSAPDSIDDGSLDGSLAGEAAWYGDDGETYFREDWPRTLLDGHNRYEICTRLELPFDIEEMRFDDRSHAEEWIIRNQFGRRNLAAYVRTQLALRLKETIAARAKSNQKQSEGRGKKGSEKSPNLIDTREEVAKAAGVSSNTVSKVEKIVAAEEAGKVDAETVAKLRTGEVSINRVVRDLKEQETAAKREAQKVVAISKRQDVDGLYLGDFRKIGDKIPDASVDLIFTDPPYDRKAIELYDGLGAFAARVLRPGGSLIAYVGHIQLPDVLADLSKHLRYWWTCGCFHSEAKARMTEYGIVAGWKPIVWFVKETRGDKQTFITDVVTGAREKSHHDWQQAVSEARYFIDLLTQEDGFVVDPFCGGGTTPVACIQSGRKWASFEIDEANFANASSRIKEVMDDQAV